jgi:hypothetical protein
MQRKARFRHYSTQFNDHQIVWLSRSVFQVSKKVIHVLSHHWAVNNKLTDWENYGIHFIVYRARHFYRIESLKCGVGEGWRRSIGPIM